jgi:opacity protein-like surface antigen
MFYVGAANANWERYPSWHDDGTRMTVSVRAGYAMGSGRIRNELGSMSELYVIDNLGFPVPMTLCEIFPGECPTPLTTDDVLGWVVLGDLPAAKDYESRGFAGNVAVGFTVPNKPQLRIEADWLHISRTNFNSAPLFQGDMTALVDLDDGQGGTFTGPFTFDVGVGAARTSQNSDIISAMVYYDFFSGMSKQTGNLIPYVGIGIGYANTRTVLELIDLYGNLSNQLLLQDFGPGGPPSSPSVTGSARDFYVSTNTTGTIAGTLAAGVAYGLMDGLFLDFHARLTYIPRVTYSLNNEADTTATNSRAADIFSIDSLTYTTLMMGLRVEF